VALGLNNDVLVTELWLQQLLALLTANAVIGVVGPMANVAPEQQRVPTIPYRLACPRAGTATDGQQEEQMETLAVDRFAQEFRQAIPGQWAELERIGGFCWLARREVLEPVGLHEKGAEDAVFDATRFSERVRRTGYRLACCRDLYVHHFGSNLLSQ
jgi:GT2 family glycosyltransferase